MFKKIRFQTVQFLASKRGAVRTLVAALGAAAVVSAPMAHATLDPSIAAGITSAQGDILSLFSAVYPFMIAIVGAGVIFSGARSLLKKGGHI